MTTLPKNVLYTERDLMIAARSVAALEKFLAEQERRFSTDEWEIDQRNELEALLEQFRAALQAQRDKYSEIWSSLHSNEIDHRKRKVTQNRNQRPIR